MEDVRVTKSGQETRLHLSGPWNWSRLTSEQSRGALERVLAAAIGQRRWFAAKARTLRGVRLADAIVLSPRLCLLLVNVQFAQGPDEVYQAPLAFRPTSEGPEDDAGQSWASVQTADGAMGSLVDAVADTQSARVFLELVRSPADLPGECGRLISWQTSGTPFLNAVAAADLAPRTVQAEQSNSSIIFGDRLILKLFRRIEPGLNPDLEVTAFLSRRGFHHVPPLLGAWEYRPAQGPAWTLATVQACVAHRGDAWGYMLEKLADLLTKVASRPGATPAAPPRPGGSLYAAAETGIPVEICAAMPDFLADAELLGRRTAEMHLALSADASDAAFAPEPFTVADAKSLCTRATQSARETLALLEAQLARLSSVTAASAQRVLARASLLDERFGQIQNARSKVAKIRCHGDYHLGQLLRTDDDFVILDFEGEPLRSLHERREKQLALRDVAGMVRSLHYASCLAAVQATAKWPEATAAIRPWCAAWQAWMSVAFLASYRALAGGAVFLPSQSADAEVLLAACMLEKAVYELRYELNNRPDWVYLPLEALEDLLR